MLKDGVGSIYESGVTGKLYQLIYELNKETQISVKSAFGKSEKMCIKENITQGSIGSGLI